MKNKLTALLIMMIISVIFFIVVALSIRKNSGTMTAYVISDRGILYSSEISKEWKQVWFLLPVINKVYLLRIPQNGNTNSVVFKYLQDMDTP